jgi:phosphoserine phosphatase
VYEEILDSWRDGQARASIVAFVEAACDDRNPAYLRPNERIAVFDNDGTLWPEQPMYVQLAFALDRVQQLSARHPEWRDDPVLGAALDGDLGRLAATGLEGIARLVFVTHADSTPEAFAAVVKAWLATAVHPRFGVPYPSLAYRPMRQLLDYLRSNGFQTFIVSGGGIEFMRVFAEDSYGVPPNYVIGSSLRTRFVQEDGRADLIRLPELDRFTDGDGKPTAIGKFIGRRPVLAAGNSDGDLEMFQYVQAGDGPSLNVLVHHDDDVREFAYDTESLFGRLDRALDQCERPGCVRVSMRDDFLEVFHAPVSPT